MDQRPSWNNYFMNVAKLVATRSTCLSRHVGAVIVKDKRIIATGYNGAPTGLKHCGEIEGCIRKNMNIPSGQRHEICRAIHAEQNAIIQAARYGIDIDGAEIYCTVQPCAICAKMIINAGIKTVYIDEGYPDEFALSLLSEAKIKLINGGL